MVKKKVDGRVRALLEACLSRGTRSLLVIVGDHGKDQVANLHYLLSKLRVRARPSVLWCYKKELGFSTHRKKRMRQLKKLAARGLHDPATDDPFELFIAGSDITWCYYKDTKRVLGRTFGMCVLQDFEALTPNLLARTVETVEGGGAVVLLLRTVKSLKQLYTMAMDVHSRLRTEAFADVTCRFNERFILSLGRCDDCLVLDDELNVLPLSGAASAIDVAAAKARGDDAAPEDDPQLAALRESLAETEIVGSLVEKARTLDQARAVMTCIEVLQEKALRSTVSITASRGRGKSAALGLALSAALGYGYSNVSVTAPSVENLQTVFQFLVAGLGALGYQEHLDFEVRRRSSAETSRGNAQVICGIVVFRDHRQSVAYVAPDSDPAALAQTELLAIDEAAAIPLPLVKRMLGSNRLVFLASTITGYEGTGRSLSLKLLQQLRTVQGSAGQQAAAEEAAASVRGTGRKKGAEQVHEQRWRAAAEAAAAHGSNAGLGRRLREVELTTPIRYASGDAVERWLYDLLCLDASLDKNRLLGALPAPRDCELYRVDRDALFSYHSLAEAFLQRTVAILTAAHYKNSPDDLQLLSDAPAHDLFVLLPPRGYTASGSAGSGPQLPDVLAVLQVCYEGRISRDSVRASLARGQKASGDMIPWTVAQQFSDEDFAKLSGARIVRLAVHPDAQGMGYGSEAMRLLVKYFQGEIVSLGDAQEEGNRGGSGSDSGSGSGSDDEGAAVDPAQSLLQRERLVPRKSLPALLVQISEAPVKRLHWVGVGFGLTPQLLRFWSRLGFRPVYVRQTASELTGEHTSVLLRPLDCSDLAERPSEGWLNSLEADFRKRALSLLSFSFRGFSASLATSIITTPRSSDTKGSDAIAAKPLAWEEMRYALSPHDLKRLELYGRNLVDHHMVTDLLPALAAFHFRDRLPGTNLSALQGAILCGMGLQRRDADSVAAELDLPATQVLALFNKAVKKIGGALRKLEEAGIAAELDSREARGGAAEARLEKQRAERSGQTLEDDMEEGAKETLKKMRKANKQQVAALEEMDMMKYAVKGTDEDWKAALGSGAAAKRGVQIKTKGTKRVVKFDAEEEEAAASSAKKRKRRGRKDKR